ncbi:MAG TPA: UDP-N-acetylglucosamine 2-epimerase (non-hydrolyzing) [Terriglobia bacterium]|nr:UDP-N-acetylglucosamine 2-epimerase (non-hydrolyzing) [Terriglobia bacterium]
MRIVSVVGARPNFMKIAPLVSELGAVSDVERILVHSGQHYDDQLSASFFRDLGLPEPDINLQVGSGSHAFQTAEIMKRLEPVLLDLKPDLVVVVGDVNSTLAAAITAAKLNIKLAHIEAGLRSFDMTMPEEINRKLTDALADLLFVTEESGVRNLRREGVAEDRIHLVGNVMIDSLLRHRKLAERSAILDELCLRLNGGATRPYGLMTLHRPSNVDDPKVLGGILQAVDSVAETLPIFFPVHPRTRQRMEAFGLGQYFNERNAHHAGLVPFRSLGYLEFLCLMDHACLVLTDSGGVQEETTALGVPCLTLRENTERPATIEQGTNQLVGSDPARLIAAARKVLAGERQPGTLPPLWDGRAAPRIVEIILERFGVHR